MSLKYLFYPVLLFHGISGLVYRGILGFVCKNLVVRLGIIVLTS